MELAKERKRRRGGVMQRVIMHETHNAHDEQDEMQHYEKHKCNT